MRDNVAVTGFDMGVADCYGLRLENVLCPVGQQVTELLDRTGGVLFMDDGQKVTRGLCRSGNRTFAFRDVVFYVVKVFRVLRHRVASPDVPHVYVEKISIQLCVKPLPFFPAVITQFAPVTDPFFIQHKAVVKVQFRYWVTSLPQWSQKTFLIRSLLSEASSIGLM